MSVCQWCLAPDLKWERTAYGKLRPFENKSRPRVLIGKDGWVHKWLLGELTMFPVTDFEPDELWGVRWVWVEHSCAPYRAAKELANKTARRAGDFDAIMKRELDEIRRRRERERVTQTQGALETRVVLSIALRMKSTSVQTLIV